MAEPVGLPASEEEFHWAQLENKGNALIPSLFIHSFIHLQIFIEPYCVPGTVAVLGPTSTE